VRQRISGEGESRTRQAKGKLEKKKKKKKKKKEKNRIQKKTTGPIKTAWNTWVQGSMAPKGEKIRTLQGEGARRAETRNEEVDKKIGTPQNVVGGNIHRGGSQCPGEKKMKRDEAR